MIALTVCRANGSHDAMADDHQGPLTLATAAWAQLLGLTHAYQAAVMRDDVAGAEVIRSQAHDLLDVNLDQNAEAATAMRSLIAGR